MGVNLVSFFRTGLVAFAATFSTDRGFIGAELLGFGGVGFWVVFASFLGRDVFAFSVFAAEAFCSMSLAIFEAVSLQPKNNATINPKVMK